MIVWESVKGSPQSVTEGLWFYNALDCMVTLEVFEAIYPQLDEITRPIYDHARDLQGPILDMECRGVRIDADHVRDVSSSLYAKRAQLEEQLKEILIEGLGLAPEVVSSVKKEKGQLVTKYMWNSPAQLKEFFYETLDLPRVRLQGVVTTNRQALEKLSSYFQAELIVAHIIGIRDINKQLSVLRTGVDRDGRMRASYNIAGTDTGRLASYASAFGSGTNQQNITEELRQIFVADPGKKMAYIDLAQVQSRAVGAICWNLFHDGTYLDFCESGDLHTGVCMMTWRDKDWKGAGLEALTNRDFYRHNRALADLPFYRVDSFRQGAKKLGHATNFMGKAQEISRQTKIPKPLIEQFQLAYYKGFPAIPEWHRWLAKKLYTDGYITTLTGRRRWFFGRRWESETVKKAAAYEPQDIEAKLNQTGMLQLWRANLPSVELLIPVHDAILIQYDEKREDELIPQILEIIKVRIPLLHGREFLVPHDVQVGWNWRHKNNNNPDGLVNYGGHDSRTRSAPVPFLDRKFRSAY